MRARSASPFTSGLYRGGYEPFHRSASVLSTRPQRSLRGSSPYGPYGTFDYDAYDRFSERLSRTPIIPHYSSPSRYYYRSWPPSTGGWATRSQASYLQRTSLGSHYPFYGPSDKYIWRYVDSLDRIGAIGARIRELDFERSLRNLRLRHPRVFNFHSRDTRDDVETNVRFRSMMINKSDNPRRYYGQSYISHEKGNSDLVRNRYKYLIKSADQKPASWNAEDQVETGYDLQNTNTDTLPSILNTGLLAEHSRCEMLMDKAGVIPRLERLKTDFIYTKSSTEHSKQLVNNLKKLKDETFSRLSSPWKYGEFM